MSRSLTCLSMTMLLFATALARAGEPALEVKGQLTLNDPVDPVRQKPAKIHEVKLSKGKAYTIDLTSTDFDSYLRLENASGAQVAFDDDGGGNLNARIKYTPAADDTFKIYVTTFAGGVGNYVLKVQGPAVAVGKAPVGEVILNIAGNIQPADTPDPVRRNPGKVHEVAFKKGKTYQIDMISKQFDAYMRLEDDGGREVAKDDDGGEGLNARIKYTADKDATYKIYATTFGGGDGNYTLTVRAAEAGVPVPVAGVIELPAPTAAKPARHVGQLQQNDPADPVRKHPAKTYTVELKAGKTYVIDMMSNQFDTYLRLENPTGQQVAIDDDGGEGTNSRILFQCTADGRYRLFATAFGAGQVGEFTISVTEQ
jgi:hypothetical protein